MYTRPSRGSCRSHTPMAASSLRTRAERTPSSRGTDSHVHFQSPAGCNRGGGRAGTASVRAETFSRNSAAGNLYKSYCRYFLKIRKSFFFGTLNLLSSFSQNGRAPPNVTEARGLESGSDHACLRVQESCRHIFLTARGAGSVLPLGKSAICAQSTPPSSISVVPRRRRASMMLTTLKRGTTNAT